MGFIYRPVPQWRFGVSIHTPTFLRLTDRYSATITTDTENYKGVLTQSSKEFTNGEPAEYSYLHFTPLRMQGGLSFVIREVEDVTKQKGFITADVEWVNYPGLKSSKYKALADKYLPNGQSGIVTFGVKGGFEAAKTIADTTKLFSLLANIGDTKSLIIHPASTTHQQLDEAEQASAGVSTDLIRLSVGLENIDDLKADLKQAFSQI